MAKAGGGSGWFGTAWRARRQACWACWVGLTLCAPGSAWAQSAGPDALRAGLAAAQAKALSQPPGNIFDRPLFLESTEAKDQLQGDVYALVNFPYDLVRQAVLRAEPWCGILILHLNVQYCRAGAAPTPDLLDVGIGRKFDQPLSDVYWLRFNLVVERGGADYLKVLLHAPTGPLGTKDMRLMVEAMPLSGQQTVLHMRYGYGYGVAARWAAQAYLATLGRDKIGFSTAGPGAYGKPQPVGGLRGVLERNTLRYYLAIEAHLGAQALPPPKQLQKSLQDWFAATERYPAQLHELSRDAYLDMKQDQLRRQQTEAPPGR